MAPSEYACVFARPPRERLVAAERLARAVPGYLAGALAQCDVHHSSATRYLAFVLRAAKGAFDPAVLARLAFWTARTGGGGFPSSDLPEAARQRFRGELNLCDRAARGIPADHLPDAVARLLRAGGSPPPAKGPPVLAVDLDGPGREALLYLPERTELVVASVLAPPVGDQLTILARAHGTPRPVEGWATVTEVVQRSAATPGHPAGFTLRIEGPTPLHDLLVAHVRAATAGEKRAAPRIAVSGPVKVSAADGHPPPRPDATAVPQALIEYATDQELAADWIENLSHGGAFVRTATPRAEGTKLVLGLALPDGVKLSAQAVVTNAAANGMGVRFVLSPEQDALLAAAMARISARPRRALVVDDVALVRQLLSDALAARGFEVTAAADAQEGVQRLSEDIMALDLLVTDLRMPGMTGEELIRFIRKAGGEADLTIVAVSGRIEPAMEQQLLAAGADAVLDKAVGPELIAAAADAAIERKRAGGST
jgi:CheY-like chemotaxis protein